MTAGSGSADDAGDGSPLRPEGRRWEHPSARSFWRSLTTTEQRALTTSARRVVFRAGAVLCHEGEPAHQVMVIESGWTKVCVSPAGKEKIIAVRGAGDLVGERAALLVRSRSATVVALDTVRALTVSAVDFAAFIGDHPRVAAVLERQVYERLTEGHGHPFAHDSADVEHRLAFLLLELALRRGVPDTNGAATLVLPLSRRELADWVDTSPETVTRTLTSWRRQGVIEVSRRRITVVETAGLRRICGHAGDAPTTTSTPTWAALNCSILLTDVSGFGDRRRDDQDRQVVRRVMYEILREGFESSDVPWGECYREDRGDGALIVVPPTVPTASVVDPLLARLAAALRRHNHQAGAAVRIQLRAALHVGPVFPDPEGVSGESIIYTARLLESPVLKARLAATEADLGFIASTFVYDTVIRHAPGYVDPVAYQQVEFQVKESEITAWMHLAGAAIEPTPARPPTPGPPPTDRFPAGLVFNGDVRVRGDLVMGDKIVGYRG